MPSRLTYPAPAVERVPAIDLRAGDILQATDGSFDLVAAVRKSDTHVELTLAGQHKWVDELTGAVLRSSRKPYRMPKSCMLVRQK